MRTPHTPADPALWKLIVAFAAIYLIWGSTYLAIRFAIETLLALVAAVTGEGGQLHLSAFSMKSILALVYLIVFGALIAFTAHIWLLRVSTPARVSTYAYVNPAVAVLLGWLLANERLDARAALAVLIILSAVVLVSVKGGEARRQASD
jgi:drug/metabolite transporter (DMT)-like permease